MTTPQPARLRSSSPDRYEEISRHLLLQAEEELDKGDFLQASEKIWLSVAHELKAIAQRRGWNHRYHNHLRAAASCLSMEWGRPDWETTFGSFDGMHTNAYEHQFFASQIQSYLNLARNFCYDLAATMLTSPPEATLSTVQQRDRERFLRTLTRPLSEQAAFGPEFTPEEEAELPPVSPTQP